MYPSTADGVSLSNSAGLAGIEQISAEQSTIVATCYGNEGTVIPYNAQIASNQDSSQVFVNREADKKISAGRACEIHLSIPNIEIGKLYKVSIDGEPATHTATAADTAEIIFDALIKQFENIGKFNDRSFEISDSKLIIKMNDSAEVFSLNTTAFRIDKIGSPFLFECLNYGAINPAIGTVTQIITNCSGWIEVINNRETSVGRDAETTTQLRQRWSASVYGRSIAMTDSIAAAIYQQCRGVTYVRVYENTSDYTDREGRVPHCVEAVVEGSDPQEICDVIFQKKGGGIDTFGDISRFSTDIQGIARTICFNRPSALKIWLKVEVTADDKEETETLSGLQNIKQAILDEAQNFTIGQDVILQKLYGVIYANVTGVGYVVIKAATGDSPDTYEEKNIQVNCRQYAVFDEARIEVTET